MCDEKDGEVREREINLRVGHLGERGREEDFQAAVHGCVHLRGRERESEGQRATERVREGRREREREGGRQRQREREREREERGRTYHSDESPTNREPNERFRVV